MFCCLVHVLVYYTGRLCDSYMLQKPDYDSIDTSTKRLLDNCNLTGISMGENILDITKGQEYHKGCCWHTSKMVYLWNCKQYRAGLFSARGHKVRLIPVWLWRTLGLVRMSDKRLILYCRQIRGDLFK